MSRLATSVPSRRAAGAWPTACSGARRGSSFASVELVLRVQFRLGQRGMVPANGVEDEAHCGVTIETPGFYDGLRRGSIATHRTVIERLEPGVVVLASGARVAADTVVYATGYRLDLPSLPGAVAARVFDADGCLRLFRDIGPPEVPSLAFVGFNSAIASPLAAEAAAHWLAACWADRMRLPDAAAMHARIAAELRWRLERRPESTRALRNACVGLRFGYMDALMREMGRPPKVRGVRTVMRGLRPADYATLLDRRGAGS